MTRSVWTDLLCEAVVDRLECWHVKGGMAHEAAGSGGTPATLAPTNQAETKAPAPNGNARRATAPMTCLRPLPTPANRAGHSPERLNAAPSEVTERRARPERTALRVRRAVATLDMRSQCHIT